MSATLTPETLAELRELASNASWPYGCMLADKAIAALPALLDAAEELERVLEWGKGRCVTCHYQGSCVCRVCKRSGMQDFNPNGNPDQWTPQWRATA